MCGELVDLGPMAKDHAGDLTLTPCRENRYHICDIIVIDIVQQQLTCLYHFNVNLSKARLLKVTHMGDCFHVTLISYKTIKISCWLASSAIVGKEGS